MRADHRRMLAQDVRRNAIEASFFDSVYAIMATSAATASAGNGPATQFLRRKLQQGLSDYIARSPRGNGWVVDVKAFIAATTPPQSQLMPALLEEMLQSVTSPRETLQSVASPRETWQSATSPTESGEAAVAESTPHDLLVTAASIGAIMSTPFIDIMDGGLFTAAPCLCCYEIRKQKNVKDAANAFELFLKYYSAESYLASRAYSKNVATLVRDPYPVELEDIADHLSTMDSTPDMVRRINADRRGKLCIAIPPCSPSVLWVYSTVEGRRLLRHLSRGRARGKKPVKVSVVSSDIGFYPRHRYRMYCAEFVHSLVSQVHSPEPAETAETTLLEMAQTWTERVSTARQPQK
jgi:hypothetical protein